MKTIIYLSILLISQIGLSQTIITDRPDQTESSSTVTKNSLQIETGIQTTQTNLKRVNLLPTSLFRIGLTKNIEIRILGQIDNQKINSIETTGFKDLEIGTKIQLFKKEKSNLEIAFLSHLIIPSGSKNSTISKFGTINKLSISHPSNTKFSLGYNIGYDYFGLNKGNLTYSLALGYSITNKLGIYIEPYGELENLIQYSAYFDSGLTYLIKNNLQVDISFGIGINRQMNYQSIGMSWFIQKKS